MNNFNKFLENKEVLILTIKQKKRKIKYYLILFYLILIFYFLYPLFVYGRRGVIIWLILLISFFFILAQELNYSKLYLLTNRRIIELISNYKDNYKEKGNIYIRNIKVIKKNKLNNVLIKVKNRNIYLINLEKRNLVYNKLYKLYERYREDY